MINGVNFGAISTDPTIRLSDETISQAHNNAAPTAPSTPAAATNVQGDSFEKKGKGKKAAIGFIATAAAALAGLAYAVKSGKLAKVELGDEAKILEKAKNIAADVGQKVLDLSKAAYAKVKDIIPKFKKGAEKAAEATTEAAT